MADPSYAELAAHYKKLLRVALTINDAFRREVDHAALKVPRRRSMTYGKLSTRSYMIGRIFYMATIGGESRSSAISIAYKYLMNNLLAEIEASAKKLENRSRYCEYDIGQASRSLAGQITEERAMAPVHPSPEAFANAKALMWDTAVAMYLEQRYSQEDAERLAHALMDHPQADDFPEVNV